MKPPIVNEITTGGFRALQLCYRSCCSGLAAELGFNRAEDSDQGGTDCEHDNNDSHADPGGNQTVFDGGDASVVCQEIVELSHDSPP